MYFKYSNGILHLTGEFFHEPNKYLDFNGIYKDNILFKFGEYTYLDSTFKEELKIKEISKEEFIEISKSLIREELESLKGSKLYLSDTDCILAYKNSIYKYYEITEYKISRTILDSSSPLTIIKREYDKSLLLEFIYSVYNKWLFYSI